MDDQDDERKNELIYQQNPIYYVKQTFKPKSWTETVVGYINEANELSQCILRNRRLMRRGYAWFVTINIEAVLTPEEITALWTKAKRKLEARGVIAIWVREPSRSNHCNYHLIVREGMTKAQLEQVIEDSLPPRREIAYHKQVERVKDQFSLPYYITKGKMRGTVDGHVVPDGYADKRLLFKPNLGLRKYGTIGPFWVKPRKQLWEEIKALEKKIAEGLGQAGMPSLVRHFHEMFGETVPLRKIERSLGAHADSKSVQDWLDHLHHEGEFPGEWEV